MTRIKQRPAFTMDLKKRPFISTSPTEATREALQQIVPAAFVEVRGEDGSLTHKLDFDALRELLGDAIADTSIDQFGFYWVGKQEAKRVAAEPTRKTLRPVMSESVDWETTTNLYIEGDNLEVLKLLQRAYLGKVKMIYIDPPYNTGSDFVYHDNFAMSNEALDLAAGNLDKEGNRLRSNPKTQQRYHSDWCSMIYSRLLVARTLLAPDGVIFISIDDNEVHHLRKICDELFGAGNFKSQSIVVNNRGGRDYGGVALQHDYLLIYGKSEAASLNLIEEREKKFQYVDAEGGFNLMELRNRNIKFHDKNRPNLCYPFYVNPAHSDNNGLLELSLEPKEGFVEVWPACSQGVQTVWRWGKEEKARAALNREIFGKANQNGGYMIVQKYRKVTKMQRSVWDEKEFVNERGTEVLKELLGGAHFDYPKSPYTIKRVLELGSSPDSLVLDFFSGSATTAHAVMQLNAEDGGRRRYICVQLPAPTPEGSEARKAGYSTICEIGKERIRRAGAKIRAEYGLQAAGLDTGFRVLRLDSSNLNDLYFEPAQLEQSSLWTHNEPIKPDRSALDLLFGSMVDWGVMLSYPLREERVAANVLQIVNGEEEGCALVACFDKAIDPEVIRYIAKLKPLRIIFREACFAKDAAKLNVYEQFKQLCDWSEDEAHERICVI